MRSIYYPSLVDLKCLCTFGICSSFINFDTCANIQNTHMAYLNDIIIIRTFAWINTQNVIYYIWLFHRWLQKQKRRNCTLHSHPSSYFILQQKRKKIHISHIIYNKPKIANVCWSIYLTNGNHYNLLLKSTQNLCVEKSWEGSYRENEMFHRKLALKMKNTEYEYKESIADIQQHFEMSVFFCRSK